jgi:hypothetical protein
LRRRSPLMAAMTCVRFRQPRSMTGVSADMDGVVPPARELGQAVLEPATGSESEPGEGA